MSTLQRSKSTPHVAPHLPFLIPSGSRLPPHASRTKVPIRRHQTSLALTDLASRSTSLRSGHHTPRTEDDPFSLGGFFPSALAVSTPERPEPEWTWLHAEQDTTKADRTDEDEEVEGDDGTRPHVMFDRAQDVRTAEMILREDKLGVLSLQSDILSGNSSQTRQATTSTSAYDRLLSPYCNDNPLDDDAVYLSFAALRDAHAVAVPPRVPPNNIDGSGPLFSPVEDVAAGKYEEDCTWPAVLSQGVGIVLDYLAI
ncbi:hypothetical protein BDY19DRAFT_915520 [Irpex rosettiformis]|uniref:Uncharacterized protein n=1 Tax=Irpex rosettiformis TaxID=378272 RepID=A0ACB8UKU2_9APHY|nr:hypothetical protein BDY19DRAFT_915520 [Irpex rosettiformis]